MLLDLLRPTLDKLRLTLAPKLPEVEGKTLQQAYATIHTAKKLSEVATPGPWQTVPCREPRENADGELRVRLSPAEVSALQLALEHVRVHMAHAHSWDVRDAAMSAICKVLAAARTA